MNKTNVYVNVEKTDPEVTPAAKLLDELTVEAEKRVHNVMVSQVPSINAQFIRYDYVMSPADFKGKHYLAFSINGEPFNEVVDTDWFDEEKSSQELFGIIVDKIVRKMLARGVVTNIQNPIFAKKVKGK